MKQFIPQISARRVFVALLLSFTILITPIAELARANSSANNPKSRTKKQPRSVAEELFANPASPVLTGPNISINDASVAEPGSGSANAVFTVVLSQAYALPITVDFTTNPGGANPGTASSDYTTTSGQVVFNAGETIQSISVPVLADADNSETDETFLVDLSGATDGVIVDAQATGTIKVNNPAGTVLISELRTSGPGGAGDDFVEILNATDSDITVPASGWALVKSGTTCSNTPIVVAVIPDGTIIKARGNYLLKGSAYSLAGYAASDQTLSADIEDDRNVALFSTVTPQNFQTGTRLDAVGFGLNTSGNCNFLRERSTMAAPSGSTSEYSFVRRVNNGETVDTNDTSADFVVVSTTPATMVGFNTPVLGAPGPESSNSPRGPVPCNGTGSINFGRAMLDSTQGGNSAPNVVRDATADIPNNSTLGTIDFRRRFTNNTGGSVTQLRFRIVDMTTSPSTTGTADLRARTSAQIMVSDVNDAAACGGSPPCTVTVEGTSLETPPMQTLGGGVNSTLAAGTITLGTPLANEASANLHFLFGVEQVGDYHIGIVLETVTSGTPGKDMWELNGNTETSNHTEGGCVIVNAAPINTVPASPVNKDEDVNLVFTGATQISMADADAGSATVRVSLTATNGTFSLSGTAGLNFSCSGCAGDGADDSSMVFEGTIANINTALNNLTFKTPLNFVSPPNASLTILTDDLGNTGTGGALTDSDTITITVNGVNDPPSFTIAANPPAVNEDAGLQTVNSFATNFQPGPVTATDESGQTLVGYTLSLSGSTGGLTFSSGPAISNTGTLTYTPAANANGTATYNVVATDSGSGSAPNVNQSAPVSFTITVNAQDDNPTLTTNTGLTVVNGGSGTIDNTKLLVSDIDNTAAQLIFTIGTAPVNGNLKKGAAVLAGGGTFTQADISNNLITYQDTNLASLSDSFTFTVSDGAGGSLGVTTFNITSPCDSNLTVTSNANSGNGTLRQAIAEACNGSTINFDMNQVVSPITLTTGELLINKNLTIQGPGANQLTVSGNLASRIFNINAGMTVTINGLTMADGRRTGAGTNQGGAVFNSGLLTITNSIISGNSVSGTTDSQGGGIYSASGSTLQIDNSTITGNSVTGGGASNGGGGIFSIGTSLIMINSTISANSVSGATNQNSGGGILKTGGTVLTIKDSTISGNSATGGSLTQGAGIADFGTSSITNSTLSGNLASGASGNTGGAIFHSGSTMTLTNCTLSSNSATDGGGITRIGGTVNVRNTIIAGNSGTKPDVNGIFVSQGHNLIGSSNGGSGFTNGVNNDKVGTAGSPLNAFLAALGNYGGPTQTHALLPGSPAINAGDNCVFDNSCAPALVNAITTDQRGFSRQVNGTVDIGAFESRGFTISTTSGTPQSTAFNTAFGAPLVATVSSAFGEPVSGGQITFTAPGSGASATFTGGVSTINAAVGAGGQVSVSATANAIVGGPYNVTATGNGVSGSADFALTNIKANQTIDFAAIANKTFGDADFVVSPTATSGLPVSLMATGQCTVTTPSPATVHITAPGSCTITASQDGNANFNAAPSVQQSFNIAKAASVTALTSSVNPSDVSQSVTFTATVTSGAGTPSGTVQFKSDGVNLGAPVALNAGGVAQFTTAALTVGTHTITAEYSGNANILASTGTLAGGQVVKPQPSLSINDAATSEGNAGAKTLNFTVTLSAASSLTVSVGYILSDGTAKSPGDYQATSGVLTFNPGVTTQTVPVTINGDVSFEPDETFSVNLGNANNALISDSQGTGTIQNDDALGGFIGFSQANTSVNESAGIVTVTVTRGVISFGQAKDTTNVLEAARVDYATDDTGASTNCAAINTGLASQRCDYTSVFGTLEFGPNETQKTIDIPINLDAYNEGPEVFTIKLSNPTGGAVAAPSTTTVTINDSASPTPNAIDDTTNFVRQQYRDILNREADAAGLAFWKNNIDKCNDPLQRPAGQTLAQCIEIQRIVTSAAFFLSIEFKQTGGMVREFYVAALDRPPTNNMPNFLEFMRDTQAIQRGVVVGQGNWQQVLDANRTAFTNEFVTRAEFVGLYPTTDTPTQYVDKLCLHANLTLSPPERVSVIGEFGDATTAADPGARGRALLRITQNLVFQAREANRTFVQMEYFGYLRRNPNDAPDNNFNGFNFWVNKLNQFNGDFLQAEMVKAFLNSLEYRSRFGP